MSASIYDPINATCVHPSPSPTYKSRARLRARQRLPIRTEWCHTLPSLSPSPSPVESYVIVSSYPAIHRTQAQLTLSVNHCIDPRQTSEGGLTDLLHRARSRILFFEYIRMNFEYCIHSNTKIVFVLLFKFIRIALSFLNIHKIILNIRVNIQKTILFCIFFKNHICALFSFSFYTF